MWGRIFNIVISISSVCSLGTIISIFINNHLNKKITSLDKQIFIYYRYIYFSGVKDALGNFLPKEQSIKFFTQLSETLLKNPNQSILLSDEVIKALNNFTQNPTHDNLNALRNRIDTEFIRLKKKNGYPYLKKWEDSCFKFIKFMLLISSVCSLMEIIVFIDALFEYGFNNTFTQLCFYTTVIVAGCFCVSLAYYMDNKNFM